MAERVRRRITREEATVAGLSDIVKKVEKDIAKSVKPKLKPEELKIKKPEEYFRVRARR